MRLHCPISGLLYSCEYMQASAELKHPALDIPLKKSIAQLSLFQKNELNEIEVHLLFCNYLLHTDHTEFHSALILNESLAKIESAQMLALAKLVHSGCFYSSSICLPKLSISKDNQDIENIISVWEDELECYKLNFAQAKLEHEARAMLERVRYVFASPLAKNRKQVITNWLKKVISFPAGDTLHPISNYYLSLQDYWIELLHKALDNDSMLKYPEADLVEFKTYLEENLPMNYAQEFSLLEEIQLAITRKQNYFGYSFADSSALGYDFQEVQPVLKRENYASIADYLNAIKANRTHPKQNTGE